MIWIFHTWWIGLVVLEIIAILSAFYLSAFDKDRPNVGLQLHDYETKFSQWSFWLFLASIYVFFWPLTLVVYGLIFHWKTVHNMATKIERRARHIRELERELDIH